MKNRFEKKHYLLFTGLALFLGASATVHQNLAPLQVHEWSSTDKDSAEEVAPAYKITYSLSRTDVEAGDEDCELCGSKTLTLESLPLDDNEKAVEAIAEALGLTTSRKLVETAEKEDEEEEEFIALEEPDLCARKKELRRLSCNANELIKQSKKLRSSDDAEDLLMAFYEDFIEDELENYLDGGDKDREEAVEILADLQSKMRTSNTSEIKERMSGLLRDSFVADAQNLQSVAQRARSHWDRSNQLTELATKAQTPQQMQMFQTQSAMEQRQAMMLEQEVGRHFHTLKSRYTSTDRQVRSVLNRAVGEDLSSMDIMNFFDTPFTYPVSSMLVSLESDPLGQLDLLTTPSLATTGSWIARTGATHGRYSEGTISQYTSTMPEYLPMGTTSIFDRLDRSLPAPSIGSFSHTKFTDSSPILGPSTALKAAPSVGRGRGL